MEWFAENKEWLLSGIAVAIPLAIIGWFFASRGKSQKQKGGNNSTNIQVGGDINIKQPQENKNE